MIAMASPDPVSVSFEPAAARLLDRARRQRGSWVNVRLVAPTPAQVSRWAAEGINVNAADPVPGATARTRWARALARALYREHKNSGRAGAVRFMVGRRLPGSPGYDPANPAAGGIPPSWQFSVMVDRGGQVARAAVRRKPDSQRIILDDGTPGPKRTDASSPARDWR